MRPPHRAGTPYRTGAPHGTDAPRHAGAPWRHSGTLIAACLALLAIAIASVAVGAVAIAPQRVVQILAAGVHGAAGDAHHVVVWNVRLPRVLLSLSTGAGLACAGVLMQALFRNPLADPTLIGVSAGAALGAVAVIVLGVTWLHGATRLLGIWTLPAAAFVGALCASLLVFTLARRQGVIDAGTMLLCGIAVNALAGACIGLMTYLASDDQLRNLTFWSLGSLAAANWPAVAISIPLITAMIVVGLRLAPSLNALLLGEAEAMHLGVRVEWLKRGIVAVTAAAAGVAVAFSGIIGFIGLVAPHLARLIVGPDHRRMLPLAALLGAGLLTLGDLVARTLVRPAELPLGILTALLGAPFFLWLLRGRRSPVTSR